MQMVSNEPHNRPPEPFHTGTSGAKAVVKTVEISSRTGKPKRRKALRACTNCQRTHLTCDDDRPCERCVKRGCADTCVDGVRKRTKVPRQSGHMHRHYSHNTSDAQLDGMHHISAGNMEDLGFVPSASQGLHPTHMMNVMSDRSYWDLSGKGAANTLRHGGDTISHGGSLEHHHMYPAHFEHDHASSQSGYEVGHVGILSSVSHYDGHGNLNHQNEAYAQIESEHLHHGALEHPSLTNDDSVYAHIPGGAGPDALGSHSYVAVSHENDLADHHHPPSSHFYHQSLTNPHAYTYTPQYYEPLDSYPLVPPRQPTMKPPLEPPSPEKESVRGQDMAHEGDSVISAMLRTRGDNNSAMTTGVHSEQSSLSSTSGRPPTSNAVTRPRTRSPKCADDVDDSAAVAAVAVYSQNARAASAHAASHVPPLQELKHQTDPMVKPEQISSSWSDLPVNALVTAHNDQSRRYHYGAGDFVSHGEVFRTVTEPFPYLPAFQQHYDVLQRKLSVESMKSVAPILTKIVRLGLAVTRPLSVEDAVFVEQCFQRSLLEERKQFSLAATACMVWRRSGNIVAVSPHFTKMAQWTFQQLSSDYITAIMNEESIVTYFKRVESIYSTNNKEFKFNCTLVTPDGDTIQTEVEVTAQKDLFNMPLTILGKFWEKPPLRIL